MKALCQLLSQVAQGDFKELLAIGEAPLCRQAMKRRCPSHGKRNLQRLAPHSRRLRQFMQPTGAMTAMTRVGGSSLVGSTLR